MKYNRIEKKHIESLKSQIGEEKLLIGGECKDYGSDHTENLHYPPELVDFPTSTKDVVSILSLINLFFFSIQFFFEFSSLINSIDFSNPLLADEKKYNKSY